MAECARKLSGYMGFDDETVQKMYLAGALHDIGKVAIGNDILEKPDRLTDEEFDTMKHHALYTYRILSDIDDFDEDFDDDFDDDFFDDEDDTDVKEEDIEEVE